MNAPTADQIAHRRVLVERLRSGEFDGREHRGVFTHVVRDIDDPSRDELSMLAAMAIVAGVEPTHSRERAATMGGDMDYGRRPVRDGLPREVREFYGLPRYVEVPVPGHDAHYHIDTLTRWNKNPALGWPVVLTFAQIADVLDRLWPHTVGEVVERAKREIIEDMRTGDVPAWLSSFAALHDYADANEYGGLCEPWGGHVELDFVVAVQAELDAWLATLPGLDGSACVAVVADGTDHLDRPTYRALCKNHSWASIAHRTRHAAGEAALTHERTAGSPGAGSVHVNHRAKLDA